MVDDLRPQLGCFGKSFMHSPHIDALAKRGQVFERAYCMVPTCGASRASLMSGLRPHSKRFVSYTARADEDAPGVTTMNQHLKDNGYRTISLGKIFHFPDDSAAGWSEKSWRPNTPNYRDRKAERQAIAEHKQKHPKRSKVRGMPYEAFDADDSEYRDHQIATRAIKHLDELQQNNSPFFLAVGFFKPHLPFCAQQKYWDLYDFSSIQVPDNFRSPPKAPRGAVHQSSELRSYATIPPKGSVSTHQARKLIHGYYACVSFIDAQVGRLMQALQDTGLSDNTVVILCGDHGWQLGDHGMWNKHSCFETSMHTPLIVSIPGQQQDTVLGGRITALTELIDIYPSVCELAGIPKPDHLHGTSFVPLLKNPNLSGKPQAVGRYRDGDTIRTDRFRLSEYRKQQGANLMSGSMLYDHRTDPNENINIADREQHHNTVKTLSELLQTTIPKSQTTKPEN
jgi:iduronate 2-sulfatase